jgi:hypothetical protein
MKTHKFSDGAFIQVDGEEIWFFTHDGEGYLLSRVRGDLPDEQKVMLGAARLRDAGRAFMGEDETDLSIEVQEWASFHMDEINQASVAVVGRQKATDGEKELLDLFVEFCMHELDFIDHVEYDPEGTTNTFVAVDIEGRRFEITVDERLVKVR